MNLHFVATLLGNNCPKLHSKKSVKSRQKTRFVSFPEDFNFPATKYLMFLPTALLGFQTKQLKDKLTSGTLEICFDSCNFSEKSFLKKTRLSISPFHVNYLCSSFDKSQIKLHRQFDSNTCNSPKLQHSSSVCLI